MKKLIIILSVLAFGLYLISCGPTYVPAQQQQYQVMSGPGGQQQVMFVDNGVQQVMEYAMFMSLMNSGGYTNVIHHYHEPSYHTQVYNSSRYSGWKSTPSTYSNRPTGSFGSGQAKYPQQQQSSSWKTTKTAPTASSSSWKTTSTPSSYKSSSSSSSSRSGGFGGGGRRK